MLTPEERLEEMDQELEDLKRGFVEAIEHLQQTPQVDHSFEERVQQVGERLAALRHKLAAEDFSSREISELHNNLWEIKELIDEDGSRENLDACDRLLVCIERIRHIVRDALDEHVPAAYEDVGLVLKELRACLPHTSQTKLARLIDKTPRTLSRWAAQSGPPPRRLRLVARLVAILRHNWSEEGIVAWFDRPREELGGKKPIALLDDANFEDALLDAARSGRSQYAG